MMLNHVAVSVKLEDVERIRVYLNRQYKSVFQIKRETGAAYILNGTLYDMRTGKVNCHLKADGVVLARPDYTVAGYSWNEGPDISMDVLPNEASRNYIACTPLIVSGCPQKKLIYAPAQGGRRGRSAIGTKAGRVCFYCSKDGSREARTPEALRDLLFSYGWQDAVMLDGGGSSQCDFDGQRIPSTRRVNHLLLLYTRKPGEFNEPKGAKPMVCIHSYSKAKDGETRLTTHFKVKEFACKDGSDPVLVAPRLAMVLEAIRTHFVRPVIITSGYRTPQHNRESGGAPHSQHCYGTAADITISGVLPEDIAAFAREVMPDWGGVGIYNKRNFVHVDVREQRADWRD